MNETLERICEAKKQFCTASIRILLLITATGRTTNERLFTCALSKLRGMWAGAKQLHVAHIVRVIVVVAKATQVPIEWKLIFKDFPSFQKIQIASRRKQD
ncbi:MAG: hypothetical protein IPK15_10845 [Verrucomicrobia bacterium]|nr:hypothetical protein [Verrucomicrobiota bacterium]